LPPHPLYLPNLFPGPHPVLVTPSLPTFADHPEQLPAL
jgi:hypothetical protein